MNALLELDIRLFQWINDGCSNALFDAVLPWCRERWFWAPFYLFVVVFIRLNFRGKSLWLILGLVASVAAADFTSSTLIKKNVRRLRPCNDPYVKTIVVQRVPCGGGYSFTSSHAANHFAAAVFLGGVLGVAHRRARAALLFWAALIAFSQVYVGVHYPADVLVGAALGCGIGSGVWLFLGRIIDK